jgi:ferredoxin
LLALKGYAVRGTVPLDFPSNWMALHPGFSRRSAQAMIARQQAKMGRFLQRILAGVRSFGGFVSFAFGLALLPVSIGYLLMGRFFLAKLFFASERCNGCGLCSEACAHHAIRMWGAEPRPYWTIDCESCMRCMAFCPRQAVEAGHSLGAVILLVLAIPVDVWAVQSLTQAWPALAPAAGSVAGVLAYWAWGMVAIILTYALCALAMRLRPIRLLFSYTTFTRLYRRYHEPSTALKQIVGSDVRLGAFLQSRREGARPETQADPVKATDAPRT